MITKLLTLFTALAALVALPATNSLTVHVVPHTHDDVGWLKTVDQYYYGLKNEIQHAAVQYVLKSVTAALIRNPERRFMYVEQAFFQRFWREATDYDKNITRTLVANGQFEFVNGGWCMHDEAAAHFIDMIDQTTLGHKFIVEEFGASAVPSIGWQIDPFGHSATQAALLSGEVGFDGLFFGRIDYQDHNLRIANKNLEFIWRASESLGEEAQVFAGAFQSGNYGPPGGLCFDVFDCNDEVIQSNPNVPDYNLDSRVAVAIKAAMDQAGGTKGDLATMNIMWNMGSDFQHEASEEWMTNLDALIAGINAQSNGTVTAKYSTPSIYLKAKNAEPVQWTVKTDDFFPYADGGDSYWTGYFTSRPALKRYIRINSAFLQVARHMEIFGGSDGTQTEALWEAQSVAQHHDAVSGTAKQAVTDDYAQRLSKGAAIADAYVQTTLASIVTQTGAAPTFSSCPLANVSICPVLQSNANTVALFYNPVARHSFNGTIGIPVTSAKTQILDASGNTVNSQVLPVMPNAALVGNVAKYKAWFTPDVQGLGINTYFVQSSSQEEEEVVAPSVKADHRHARQLKSLADQTLESDRLSVAFDSTTNLISSVTDKLTGKNYPFAQDFAFYESWQSGGDQNSGAYIFRPAHEGTIAYTGVKITNVINGALISEAWQQVSPYITQIIRLRAGSVGIEFEYTVGPIDISDNQGREVIIRFNTSIASNSTFYTDSNGREFQQRIRNYRPTWKWDPTQPTAGNYYPINAGAYLTDGTDSLIVVNDRSQGGASMTDGSLEVMLHRRMTQDDGRGVGEALNEPGLDGKGLIITGHLFVALVPAATAIADIRVAQSAIYSPYHVSYAPLTTSIADYASGHITALTYLKTDLPLNVELITAQVWGDNSVLIRLSHSFGVNDNPTWSQPVTVDLSTLFVQPVKSVAELTLTAALPKGSRTRWSWNTTSDDLKSAPRSSPILAGSSITLNPLEIKTFVVSF